MLGAKFIRENKQYVKEGVKAKGYNSKIVDEFLSVDKDYRKLLTGVEELRRTRNQLSRKNLDIKKAKEIKMSLQILEMEINNKKNKLEKFLNVIPNLPLKNVPEGLKESDNKVIKTWGKKPKFSFEPKNHLEIGKMLG